MADRFRRATQISFIQSKLSIHNAVMMVLISANVKDSGSIDAMKVSLRGIMDLSKVLIDIAEV